MRKQRTAHRARLLVTIIGGVFVAFGTFWLLQVLEKSGEEMQAAQRRNEPDYIVDNFSFVRMTKTGQPGYIISGARLTHRPFDDSSEVDKPFVRSLTQDKPPMDIHADRGRVDENNSRVQLNGNVLVDRQAGPGSQPMVVRTEAMTVYPDTEKMATDRPIAMMVGNSMMTGVGMQADNASRQIDVNERVRITYPPAQR